MSGFLIDTNVETTDRLSQHVSVITLAEIKKGIELLAGGKRRSQLEQWLTDRP